jgi:hypothetical protein
VTQKTMLRFKWRLEADDFNEECDVQLLCRHAVQRGVHVPSAWKVPAVDALARAAVQRAREELSLSDATKLDCRQPSQAYTHTCEHEHKHVYLSMVITLLKVRW